VAGDPVHVVPPRRGTHPVRSGQRHDLAVLQGRRTTPAWYAPGSVGTAA
jgi:hypothetical protein